MVLMKMMDDYLGREAVIESPHSRCIFLVVNEVVVFLENKPHSHGVTLIWCCCCVAAAVICCSQFVRGGKKTKQKQKHASVCTRVRNNVFDEAAHTMCRCCARRRSIRAKNAILSYLFITEEHRCGAPSRLRGLAPPPPAHTHTAERTEKKNTKDCGCKQSAEAAEGEGWISVPVRCKWRHESGNGPCVFRVFSCGRANNWFILQRLNTVN